MSNPFKKIKAGFMFTVDLKIRKEKEKLSLNMLSFIRLVLLVVIILKDALKSRK